MSPTTSPPPNPATAPLLLNDEDYNSAEDDDFDPNAAATATTDDANSDSDSDSGEPSLPRKKRKRRGSDSTIASCGEDSGGEGGFIKTRAQRVKEGFEKPRIGGVLPTTPGDGSTDVDELWRQMNSKPTKTVSPEPTTSTSTALGTEGEQAREKKEDAKEGETKVNAEGEEIITISRTYTFAGTTHTELKTVPRSSQEARIYLSNISSNSSHSVSSTTAISPPIDPTLPPRRPPPKKRASVFDAAAAARKPAAPAPAQKLSTLEKSRLDWAGFVDKEGISEELKKHTRGDKAFLDRQAFLGRVEENRDRAWKEGQKK